MNITSDEIVDILKKKWPDLKYIWRFDPIYTIISKEQLESLIEPITQKFDSKKFDCDKFSLVTHSQVSLKVAADPRFEHCATFGQIMMKHTISKEIHAVNILLDPAIHLFEPQGQHYINGKNMNPFFVRI